MIRVPTDDEIELFRRWAKNIKQFADVPVDILRADDMQELTVQHDTRRDLLVFSPAALRWSMARREAT